MTTLRKRIMPLIMISLLAIAYAPLQAQDCSDLSSANAFYERGSNAQNADNHETAIADFTCAINLNDQDPDFYNDRGISYENLERYTEALADYEAALALNPDYFYAYNNRGNIYYYRGQYDAAIEEYTLSIEKRPDGQRAAIPYYNRANTYYERGQYQLALADYNASIADDSEYNRAYLGRAATYLVLNDDRAHADYQRWIELNRTTRLDLSADSLTSAGVQLEAGTAFYITFDAQATQVVDISARTNSNADPLIVLLDPDGTPIASDDDSGINLNAVLFDVSIPRSGTYTLLLSHAGGRDSGSVSVSINLDNQLITTNDDAQISNQTRFASYTLYPDTIAEVYTTGGDTLNVREGPGISFEIVTRLNSGERVRLLEGPRKNDDDGYVWWRIRNNEGIEGWAVERADDEQTLQLALIVGEEAIITTGGDTLNMRNGAGTNFALITQLEENTRVTLLAPPIASGGYVWWNVRTADGTEGFVIDRFDGDRMLVPAREIDYAGGGN